ncbi:X-Pro dipeptidyl-peptidase (S15 family) [Spongiibacter sp. IMCC21906]|uniref:alpha/beta hydrolase n=1 Tax=Spongiibacter sp. IMCC21906 TaxID=1620392 RepID=UPI00062DDB1C|nr:CocE/NonD family hydrolase [Spongiibacter sp. IMCC21906]AKH70458.1 X-Pro dipeptidyl-peptidase (S15 family) [Spongiibacter sp. IMCC21906]
MPNARFSLFATTLFAVLLTACGGSSSSGGSNAPDQEENTSLQHQNGSGTAENKNHFDQIIPAADGEDIAFSVFVPDNPSGKAVPLVIHSHGFGLSRIKDFENQDPVQGFTSSDVSGDVAGRSWLEEGYYVISFDQRGFGDSGGDITVMDPDLDCDNVSRIIDWAEANLSNLGYRDSDPAIGAIGLSYGGGFQTVCSSVDTRFDALVPMATWSHLPYSLYPGNTPKNIWLDLLAVASMGNLAPYLNQALLEATTTGDINDDAITKLAGHSPRSFCQGEMGRSSSSADALFIQGSHDVLFNINEAVENYECWKAQGLDTHLLIQRDGHILPGLQTAGDQILFGTDATLYCNGDSFDTRDVAMDFLRSKLSGDAATFALPDICFSLASEQSGQTFNEVPRGGEIMTLPSSQVIPGGLNSLVTLLQNLPLDTLLTTLQTLPPQVLSLLQQVLAGLADPASLADSAGDIVNLLPADLLRQLTAPPQFIPLQTIATPSTLAGIPLASLELSGGNGDGNTLYVGLGRIAASGSDAVLINDQVLPVTGTGTKLLEMNGVSQQLEVGDELGLIVYGFHPYFIHGASLAQPPLPLEVNGEIDIPIAQGNQ